MGSSQSKGAFYRKSRFVNTVAIVYLFVGILAVILEFFKDRDLLHLVKPLVMPTLIFMYWCSTRRINTIYLVALLAAWVANLFATSSMLIPMVVGTLFLLIFKVFYVKLLTSTIKVKEFFPLAVSSVPFLLFYTLLSIVAYSSVKDLFFLYLTNSILFVVMGAYALANFFSKSRKSSVYLLVAVGCLMIDQVFSFVLNGNFEAVGLLFFYLAQYLFCRFLVLDEKRRRHHDSFTIHTKAKSE